MRRSATASAREWLAGDLAGVTAAISCPQLARTSVAAAAPRATYEKPLPFMLLSWLLPRPGLPVLFGDGSGSGAATPDSAGHSGSSPWTRRAPTKAPRKVASHSVDARVMDRPGASAASKAFRHEKL